MKLNTYLIVGGGAWATALGTSLIRAGRNAVMLVRDSARADDINFIHENRLHLPGISLPPELRANHIFNDLSPYDAIILAVPAQTLRSVCHSLKMKLKDRTLPLLLAAKGLEENTSLLLSEVVRSELPDCPVAVISGPSFAEEVARGLPTALTLACDDSALALTLLNSLASTFFRLYSSTDLVGVQIGGAIKNVLAISSGIVVGRNLGENARAALISRGLAELVRLGLALGGKQETLMGLSGLGDLILTCSSKNSRNMSFGISLGEGHSIGSSLDRAKGVVEGFSTAPAALSLAKKYHVDMPIISAVNEILSEKSDITMVMTKLLSRPLKCEID